MILAVFLLCRRRAQWSPLLLSLLKDLLDVGGVPLEQWVVFGPFVGGGYWLCARLWTEVPLDLVVLKLVFYLVDVDFSVCALMWAYIHNSNRPLNSHWG